MKRAGCGEKKDASILPVLILAISSGFVGSVLMLLSGCGEGKTGAAAEEAVYSVRTARAETRDIQEYLEAGGDVITETSVDIFPDIAGKLVRLYADAGDFVAKGGIVAEIDPSKPGLTYALSPVRSPISGTITEVPGKIGATVEGASVIARIGQLGRIQVKTLIPEKEIGKVRPGQKGTLAFEAWPGEVFTAEVSRLSPVVDPVTRTKEIRLTLSGPASRISVGMFARVTINTILHAACTVVPESAVSRHSGGQAVFVVNAEGRAEERRVVTGISLDGFVEIKEGVSEGEIIVSEGQSLLSDGDRVRILSGRAGAL